MTDFNEQLAASMWLALQSFDNKTLATFNIAVQLSGKIPPESISYKPAVQAGLIKDDGSPHSLEELRTASAAEVNRRVREGTFN